MTDHFPALPVSLAVVTLLVVGCGSSNARSSASSTLTASSRASTPASAPQPTSSSDSSDGEADLSLRYDSATQRCGPDAPTSSDFVTSAPRPPQPVGLGQAVDLSIHNRADLQLPMSLTVKVITPDGTVAIANGELAEMATLDLRYPAQFTGPGTKPSSPGDFTVLWEEDGALLACDGWTAQVAD